MGSESIMDDIRALSQRASIIRETVREICDVRHDFKHEADQLDCVLRRLQQEATRGDSPLNKVGDTRRLELKNFSPGCLRKLDEIYEFLTKCKEYHAFQTRYLPDKGQVPLSATDNEVLGKFRSDCIYYVFHISHFTVKASMEFVGEAKGQIENASYTLRYAVNTVTARFLADNKLDTSTLADSALWEKVFDALREEGISNSFLKKHRTSILAYIKAIETRTAFEHIREPPVDIQGCGTARWEAAQEDRYRSSYHDSPRSSEVGDLPGMPFSRRSTRSNEDMYRQTRHDGRANNAFQSQSSTKPNKQNSFRFSDPLKVFQSFKEREGPEFDDEETLELFLGEDPAQPPSVRDEVRKIYQAYDNDFEPRCESLLSRKSSQDRNKDVKAYIGLIDEIERQVVGKLDELHLGDDMRLRALRKKIIDKVNRMLEDLDGAKPRLQS